MIPVARMPFDVVGFQYQADLFCPNCILNALVGSADARRYMIAAHRDVDNALDNIARQRGIDRMDEESFDSDEFPKVIFRDQLESDEVCGWCHSLIED